MEEGKAHGFPDIVQILSFWFALLWRIKILLGYFCTMSHYLGRISGYPFEAVYI